MKGIPTLRLSRLKRTAAVAGVGALVVAGTMLGATQAHALDVVLGTDHGALTLVDTTATLSGTAIVNRPTSDVLSYSTTEACPAAEAGSATLFAVSPTDPTGQNQAQLAPQFGSVAAPWSQNLSAAANTVAKIGSAFAVGALDGTTTELVVQCQNATQTASAFVMDTFITVNAAGSTFTVTNTPPAVAATTTVTLQASSPDYAGQPITLTATVKASDGSTPQGTVTFENGTTAFPVTTSPASGPNPATLTNGSATFVAEFATAGTETLNAAFTSSNTASWGNSSTTTALSLTVSTAPTFSGNIPVNVTVPTEGSFTLTVTPTPVALTPDSTGLNATGTIPNGQIMVTDTRNSFPGWSVSGQDGSWTGSGTAAGGSFSGNQLGWTPTGGTPLPQNVVLGSAVTPASPGLGSAAVLASVVHGLQNGYGTTNLGAGLTLVIPANQPAGPYSSSLTITAVNTN